MQQRNQADCQKTQGSSHSFVRERKKKRKGIRDLQIEILTQDVIFYKCIEKIFVPLNICSFFHGHLGKSVKSVSYVSYRPIIFLERN